VKRTSWSAGLSVTGGGSGVVAHAGSVGLRLVGDRTGLTAELSTALARRSFVPVHDRGRVLVDVAVMIADGGEAIADIDVLRHQSPVLGPIASPATVWRALDAITPAAVKRIATARARVRRHVWDLLAASKGRIPASKVAGTDLGQTVVLDVDATIVIAHSEKEQASATFKKTFGFHPLGVWCDNTSEFLAGMLRTGKAGSNTAADHIEVIGAAIAQIPGKHRKDLLVRCDGAGASHDLLDWLTEQGQVRGRRLEYSVGYAVTEKIRDAISLVPAHLWVPASDVDGGVRAGGDVAELTGLLDLRTWPEGMRVIVRRERPHPGAQLSLFEEADGWRYQAIATNTATGQLPFLEARHRAHARVEDRIRHAKDTGLGRFPSREFTINQAWLTATTIAADLTAWTRLLAFTGDAKVLASCEPKALRYRLLHVPARLTHSARRRRLQIPDTWPWAAAIVAVFANIAAIPPPA
jgi:Transposase DDE domain group 1